MSALTDVAMYICLISVLAVTVSTVFGARLLNKYGARNIKESIIWFGYINSIEKDLNKLSISIDDPSVLKTLKRIRFFKSLSGITFVLFIALAFWGGNK